MPLSWNEIKDRALKFSRDSGERQIGSQRLVLMIAYRW